MDLSVLKEYYSVPFEDRKPYLHTLLKLLYREYIKIGRRFIATKQSDGSVTFQRNPGDRPIDPTAAIPPALFDSMTVIFAPLENLDGEEFNFFFSSSGLTNTVHLLGSVLHNMHHIMTGEGILLTEVPTALSVISEEDEEGEDAHAAEPGACTAIQDEEPWQEVQTSKNMKKKRTRKSRKDKNPPQYNGSTHATQSAI